MNVNVKLEGVGDLKWTKKPIQIFKKKHFYSLHYILMMDSVFWCFVSEFYMLMLLVFPIVPEMLIVL